MISLRKTWRVLVLVSVLGSLPVQAPAQNGNLQEQLMEVFHPYRQGGPKVEGITPGMKITKDNHQVAAKVLPLELLRVVQAGDMEITVQDTTDLPLHQDYIAASIEHFGQTQIGEDGNLKKRRTSLWHIYEIFSCCSCCSSHAPPMAFS